MLKDECTVYLCMYINISCICKNNTANHLKFGQQLNWIYIEGNSLIMKLGSVYKDYDSFLFFELL